MQANSRTAQCSEENIAQHLQTIDRLENRIRDTERPDPGTSKFDEMRRNINAVFNQLRECKFHSVEALVSLLASDRVPEVRHSAVIMLGEIGAQAAPAISSLIVLLQDVDADIHFLAAKALAKIGEPSALKLLQVLDRPQTQRDVAYALGQISPTNEEILDRLKKLVDTASVDMDVRWMAAAGLDRNGKDQTEFFRRHELPSPLEESLKCMMANEDWDKSIDEARSRNLYIFDIYSQECRSAQTYDPTRSDPSAIIEEARERLRALLGKE